MDREIEFTLFPLQFFFCFSLNQANEFKIKHTPTVGVIIIPWKFGYFFFLIFLFHLNNLYTHIFLLTKSVCLLKPKCFRYNVVTVWS